MIYNSKRLYLFFLAACIAGYGWIFYNFRGMQSGNLAPDVCLIKRMAHIPCPSCGSSRAVLALVQGHFVQSFYINPIGFIIALIMLIAPIWILRDFTRTERTLLKFYQSIEVLLKRPTWSIPLLLMLLANWIWNIAKGL